MIVFISWSGARSHYVAQVLRTWLKDVLHVLEPWVSSEDIRQGARWNVEIAGHLEEAKFGIVCLTQENLAQPWILFEAGALAKTLSQSFVCPYLIDIKPTELVGPLVQFQAARSNKEDTLKLLHTINGALNDKALPEDVVERSFQKWWPDLETALRNIPKQDSPKGKLRSDREILEEILNLTRRTSINTETLESVPPWREKLVAIGQQLFEGKDVNNLLLQVDSLGKQDDPNAEIWFSDNVEHLDNDLNGLWASRWQGGRAKALWANGVGLLQVFQHHLYVLHHDGRADCLIASQILNDGRLAGRYINLEMPNEVLPWAGRIIDKNRIDGFWAQGRWDLRRK